MNKKGFTSVDEYIMTFPKETRKILRQVRAAIKAAAPGTKETISYNIPTFTLDGKYLIYFAGWKNHVSLYPIPSGTEAFNKEVAKYAAGKGTLKFPLDEPVPLKLIGRIVKYRLESLKQAKTKYGK